MECEQWLSYELFSVLEVEMDLAGSIAPEDLDEQEQQEKDQESTNPLEARPDLKIRLRKQSGRTVLFHCSFPVSLEESAGTDQDSSNLRMSYLF